MKSFRHYPAPLYQRPSKLELATFGLILVLAAFLLGLLVLSAGCANSAPFGQTASERKLTAVQSAQLSQAAAAVSAAKLANETNPDGLPKTAIAGELSVADANLPDAKPADVRVALARVNKALAGKLSEAQAGWNEAVAHANTLTGRITALEKQIAAERATAAANEKKANDRLCIIAVLSVGGVFSVAAGLSLAAGMYFGLAKLQYGAAGLGLCGALAFFTATQVGSARFNLLAILVIGCGLAAAVYSVWHGFQGGSTIKHKAAGFERALDALRKFASEVTHDAETDAKHIWHWLGLELDQAHKALIADWHKLEAVFATNADAPAKAPPSSGA